MSQTIPSGVTIALANDDGAITPTATNSLGAGIPGTIRVRLTIDRSAGYKLCTAKRAPGNPPTDKFRELPRLDDAGSGSDLFKINVRLTQKGQIVVADLFPRNCVRLFKFDDDGCVHGWDVAIVTQWNQDKSKAKTFLSVSNGFDASCYNRDGKLHCPDVVKRPSLHGLFESWCPTAVDALVPFVEQPETPTIPDPTLGEGRGRVLWYNPTIGLGLIIGHDRVARVHWSRIKVGPNQFKTLRAGDIVTVDHYDELKSGISKFEWEAIDVKKVD